MTAIIIACLVVAFGGVLAFFVLPAAIAWIGWVAFAVGVLAMLIAVTVGKKSAS